MIEHYFFPEAGTISGIPGTFAGVQVEVDTDTNEIIKVSPLARHPHFQASREPEVPPSEPEQSAEMEAPTNGASPADEADSHPEGEGV